jgi:hypothetical protein
MPYGKNDVRSALPTAAAQSVPEEMAAADYLRFAGRAPDLEVDDARIWYARGQNFVVGYGEVDGHVELRFDEHEEHMLLLPDPLGATRIVTADESVDSPGQSVIVLPPGLVTVSLDGTFRFVSLVRSTSHVADLAENAASYATAHPGIPPFMSWPQPPDGYRVRVYDATVPAAGGTMRIFRCTTFMVNFFNPKQGPRDRTRLSPHHHDDFEQCSLVLEGQYAHHLRWPWGTDATKWREDDHELCGSPSVAIFPPPAIHTSEALDPGTNHLIDIFSPPREDFSRMPGWVMNADDYPMPEAVRPRSR